VFFFIGNLRVSPRRGLGSCSVKGSRSGYTHGSVVHKLYPRNLLPSESSLENDVLNLSKHYVEFCSRDDAWDLYSEMATTEAEFSSQIDQLNSGTSNIGQEFSKDSKIRRAIEQYAVDKAITHFTSVGWRVDPSPQKNRPYDLLCEWNGTALHVEVKGAEGSGEKVKITRGEAKHAQANPGRAVLFVLSDIRVQPGPNGALNGGTERVLQPWNLHRATLIPISYEHSLRYPAT
jgi:hypothetical protein